MKLSVLANLYHDKTLEETLAVMKGLGLIRSKSEREDIREKRQCDPAVLLKDKTAFYKFRETFNAYDIEICALAAHGAIRFIRIKKQRKLMTRISKMRFFLPKSLKSIPCYFFLAVPVIVKRQNIPIG